MGKGALRRAHHFSTGTLIGGHASLCPPYDFRFSFDFQIAFSSSLRAKRSNPSRRLWHCGLLRRFAPRNDDGVTDAHFRIPAAGSARVMLRSCPSKSRGRRECRMLAAPAALCARVESTQVSHYRSAGTVRHSPRDGLRLTPRSPWCTGLDSHHRPAIRVAELDSSVGESGPHGFAVRTHIARQPTCPRPSHPKLHVRDDAYAPLGERGMRVNCMFSDFRKQHYFCGEGWTGQIRLKSLSK